MFEQIVAGLNAIVLLVMFIGYWTYADYYTNLNSEFKKVYWFIHIFMYFFAFESFLIAETPEKALMIASKIITFVTLIVFSSCTIVFIGYCFSKSRKYFGRKRNKL